MQGPPLSTGGRCVAAVFSFQVRRAALQSGILAQTSENAQKILVPLLTRLSGRRVVLVTTMQVPTAPKQ